MKVLEVKVNAVAHNARTQRWHVDELLAGKEHVGWYSMSRCKSHSEVIIFEVCVVVPYFMK